MTIDRSPHLVMHKRRKKGATEKMVIVQNTGAIPMEVLHARTMMPPMQERKPSSFFKSSSVLFQAGVNWLSLGDNTTRLQPNA